MAGVYRLEWNILDRYFPNLRRPTVTKNSRGAGEQVGRKTVHKENNLRGYDSGYEMRKTEPFNHKSNRAENMGYRSYDQNQTSGFFGQANAYSQAEIDKEIERWNWGAFFCSWLWAICHRIYWPIAILVIGLIPYLGQIASLALSVYLGLEGSRLAWNSGEYKDFEQFKSTQRKWMIGGVIWFIISVASTTYILSSTLLIL